MTDPIATIRTQDDLIEALRAAKAMRGLSNDFCDERGGLTRGHTDKVLGPTRQVTQPDDVRHVYGIARRGVGADAGSRGRSTDKAKWEGRDMSNVRTGEHKVSRAVLERAKPHVLKDFASAGGKASGAMRTGSLGSEIMRRIARRGWRKRRKSMRERLKERKAMKGEAVNCDPGSA